jgi:hypothetical protein
MRKEICGVRSGAGVKTLAHIEVNMAALHEETRAFIRD